MRAVHWISKLVAVRIHDVQLERHGGDAGFINEQHLDAAIARPRTIAAYEPGMPIARLAAALAVSLAKS